MRKDLIIDGFAFSRVAVGGMDATEGVLAIVHTLNRRDINVIFLSGCVIAFFNIIDPAADIRMHGFAGHLRDLRGLHGTGGRYLPPFSRGHCTAGRIPAPG